MAFCTSCGSPFEEGNRFCSRCGAPVREPEPVSATAALTQVIPVEEAKTELIDSKKIENRLKSEANAALTAVITLEPESEPEPEPEPASDQGMDSALTVMLPLEETCEPEPDPEPAYRQAFCTACGAPIEESSRFCTACGAPIENPAEEATAPSGDPGATDDISSDLGISELLEALPGNGSPYNVTSGVDTFVTTPAPANVRETPVVMADAFPVKQQYAVPPQYQIQPPIPPEPKKKRWPLIVTIVSVAVIVAAVVFAVWWFILRVPPQYTVAFNTAGGSDIPEVVVAEDKQITAPSDPDRDGYEFEGWYADPGYTEVVHFPLNVDANTTLYAKWEKTVEKTPTEAAVAPVNSGKQDTKKEEKESSESKTAASANATVSITVEGADGTTRTETIHLSGNTDRVLPNSNDVALTASDISGLSDAEKCIAWNEIIASNNGYVFKNSGLREYFNGRSWYHPNVNASSSGDLFGTAANNVMFLQENTSEWWRHLATR